MTAIHVERGRVTGVGTDKGAIETEIVVDTGGIFAGEIGRLAGVNVGHSHGAQYLVRAPPGFPDGADASRSSLLVYFRGESGGLLMGGYERDPAPGRRRSAGLQQLSRRTASLRADGELSCASRVSPTWRSFG